MDSIMRSRFVPQEGKNKVHYTDDTITNCS